MDKQNIEKFYRKWTEKLPQLVDAYTRDENKRPFPTRLVFSYFKNLLEKFLNNQLEDHEKIVILPGIRGVGKTTLLMQMLKAEIFLNNKDQYLLQNLNKLDERFYLDVGRLKLEGIALNDFFNFFEETKDFQFENLHKKYLLLLDEVHYDDNWGLFLKNIFDRTKGNKNILIIATGSSAVSLRMNPDLSRRATVEDIYPMEFSEYLLLEHGNPPIENLSGELQEIIFHSFKAEDVYKGLKNRSPVIDRFFAGLPSRIEESFFDVGNFPFTVRIANQIKALELISNVINSIIIKDVIPLKKFKTQTIAKINTLLYLVANSDVISYEKLRDALKIEEFRTIDALIEVLIMSGILVKIRSYGKTYGSARKTPKLLFIAQSLRAAVLEGNFLTGVEGKKLEDYFALIYMKNLKNKWAVDIFYDIAEGGADFILTLKDRSRITIEVGFGKEDITQVVNTQKKIKGKYGIVFGSRKLELINNSIIKIPLKYLLLI